MSKGALLVVVDNDLDPLLIGEYQAKLGLGVDKIKTEDMEKDQVDEVTSMEKLLKVMYQ